MARKKQVAVIGLGRFGASMCRTLIGEGVEVLGVDLDERRVAELAGVVTHIVRADSTDESVLAELDIRSFDSVVVAIGEDVQASILTALMVRQAGVEDIWAKATSDYHAKVLELIGVSHVVHPERDMGKRIAQLISSETLIDFIDLSGDHRLIELVAPAGMVGRSLAELDIRAKFGCIVVGFKRGEHSSIAPDPTDLIEAGDVLFVIGANEDLRRLQAKLPRS
ncbi:MAG: TrkA family potassium uptake protein [Gaiellales bacterium]